MSSFEVAPVTIYGVCATVPALWDSVLDPGVGIVDGGSASAVQSDAIDGGPADAVQVLWLYGGLALFPW